MIKNDKGECLVQHHIKYKELHGVDETIWMTKSEHGKLHHRLRTEKKCNISSDLLNKISTKAHRRTDMCKTQRKEYRESEHGKKVNNEYSKINQQQIHFHNTPGSNIDFMETITYNYLTGNISYSAGFYAAHGLTLPVICIMEVIE